MTITFCNIWYMEVDKVPEIYGLKVEIYSEFISEFVFV